MDQPWDRAPLRLSSPPADRAAVEAAARAVGLPFPPEYVAFLLAHNGGSVGHWPRFPIEGCKRDTHGLLHVLYGVGRPKTDLAQTHQIFRGRMPPELLPIGSDPGGNQVCLVCAGGRAGKVVFWERAFEADPDAGEEVGWGNVYRIADGLGDFFSRLEEDAS